MPKVGTSGAIAVHAKWPMMAYGLSRSISLAGTILLARILGPSSYGELALALVFINSLYVLSDFGLGSTLIQQSRLTLNEERLIFGALLIIAPGLALVGVMIGAVMAASGHLELGTITFGLAGLLALNGGMWFYTALLRKQMRFPQLMFSQLVQAFIGAALSVGLAFWGLGPISFVLGQIIATLVAYGLLVYGASYRVTPRWKRGEMLCTLKSGTAYLAQGGLGFIAQNIDNLMVGVVVGSAALGLYSISYRLASTPCLAVSEPVSQVTFVQFSSAFQNRRSIEVDALRGLSLVALGTGPLVAILVGGAHTVVRATLGERWTNATGIIIGLALWSAFRPIQNYLGWLLNSLGKAQTMARVAAVTLLVTVPCLYVGARYFGTYAVAFIMSADMMISLIVLASLVVRSGICSTKTLVRRTIPVFGSTAVAAFVTWMLQSELSFLGVWPLILVEIPLTTVAFALICCLVARDGLRDVWAEFHLASNRSAVGPTKPVISASTRACT